MSNFSEICIFKDIQILEFVSLLQWSQWSVYTELEYFLPLFSCDLMQMCKIFCFLRGLFSIYMIFKTDIFQQKQNSYFKSIQQGGLKKFNSFYTISLYNVISNKKSSSIYQQ